MDITLIVELAAAITTHCFVFGGAALAAWTRRHRDPHTGRCEVIEGSDWYLVLHRSLDPVRRPDFWILNRWRYLQVVPVSFDVPPGAVDLSRRQPLIGDYSEAQFDTWKAMWVHDLLSGTGACRD